MHGLNQNVPAQSVEDPAIYKIRFNIDSNEEALQSNTDRELVHLWNIGEAVVEQCDDAGTRDFSEKIGREIVRRWLPTISPEQPKAPGLTIDNLRRAIEISIAGFGGEQATPMNAGDRAHVFVCALSGVIGQYDKSLSDAIFAVIQSPDVTARLDEVLA